MNTQTKKRRPALSFLLAQLTVSQVEWTDEGELLVSLVRGLRTWEAIDDFSEDDLFVFTKKVVGVRITDGCGRQWSWRVCASRGGYFTRLDGQRTTSAFLAFKAVMRPERSEARIWPYPHTVALALKGGEVVVIGQRRAGLVASREREGC